jgi:hypothetical protein
MLFEDRWFNRIGDDSLAADNKKGGSDAAFVFRIAAPM